MTTKANYIVTENLKDFPASKRSQFGIGPIHPDEFALSLYSDSADKVMATLIRMAADYEKPRMTVHDILDALSRAKLPGTAVRVLNAIEDK